ncbi:hypothetical protein MNBD_ACTINO02-1984 [hydrothermal vent metagenome]|uniref:Uncharacterized protein n=1 Tax=hydrothermal vent metagenome TaxID=652676 RepID=A0A3B0TJU2_9ZZZZ
MEVFGSCPGLTAASPDHTGRVTILEFTAPEDRAGTCQIGCFQEAGQHYEDGMHATLIVETERRLLSGLTPRR